MEPPGLRKQRDSGSVSSHHVAFGGDLPAVVVDYKGKHGKDEGTRNGAEQGRTGCRDHLR